MYFGFVTLNQPKILTSQYWEVGGKISISRWWNWRKICYRRIWYLRGISYCEYICNFCIIVYLWEGGWDSLLLTDEIFLFRIVCTKVNLTFFKIVLFWSYFRNIVRGDCRVIFEIMAILSQGSYLSGDRSTFFRDFAQQSISATSNLECG